MKNLKIGICGWGNVATGLYKTINSNYELIRSNGNVDIEIVVIGARRDNPKCNPVNVKIERDIFNVMDHEIDVVVELIGGVDVARELILSAIKNKKHVVTANKAVIFHHGDEIFKEAALNGVKVLFESSVCAGTPIIKLLFEELAANKITKIAGMLNGTSNFILSNMEEGADFKPTLELAQKEGYAEPDPTFDIEGMDAAHKIGILSSLAFGTPLPPEDFYIEGISEIEKIDFKYAMEMGYTVKHLAVTKYNQGNIELRAHPVLIDSNSYLANLKSVRNGIEVETDLLGTLHIAGSGAGQESTASGVISDIVHLANSNINIAKKVALNKTNLVDFLTLSFQYYFYIEAEDIPGVMASITSMFAEKKVGIESIVQKEDLAENMVPIVLITDPFIEKDHKELISNILNLDSVNKVRSIRIETD
ncbi:MAG: homoserine dehydrogenase [Gammaproteobacteria bacterium]|tara:strand:- start:1050 stop:2312 length:1263 start_codon:yes stop_codon:yes gene_type:complete